MHLKTDVHIWVLLSEAPIPPKIPKVFGNQHMEEILILSKFSKLIITVSVIISFLPAVKQTGLVEASCLLPFAA